MIKKREKLKLRVGHKVLLLLPDSTQKFRAKWQGPYEISRKIGKVNYDIVMPEIGNQKQVFHINMLKLWNDRIREDKSSEKDGDHLLYPGRRDKRF